ncbi:sporulation protein YqfD [Terrilactibacillus sp. S3-3]|nr:sporulation protein YqfD [Terrilactibacillus sp. S3-3]
MIIGIFLSLLIIGALSNMVWRIDVKGADPKLEEEIRNLLKKDHLYVGSFEFFIPPLDELESMLSGKVTKATWINVSRDGTTYRVDVVQKELPKKAKKTGPRNLVAAKKAIIHRLFVERGQPVVESDQYVKPGQMLVSGMIGKEEDPKFVSAKGKVIGETWYQSTTSVPLESRYATFTGKTYVKRQLRVFQLSLPVWGLQKKPYRAYDTETIVKPIHFLFWDLPVAYKTIVYREKKTLSARRLTVGEALAEGKKASVKKLLSGLPGESEIVSHTIDKKQVKKGRLLFRSHFVVYENIARPRTFDPVKMKQKLKKKEKKERQLSPLSFQTQEDLLIPLTSPLLLDEIGIKGTTYGKTKRN